MVFAMRHERESPVQSSSLSVGVSGPGNRFLSTLQP